MITYEEVKHKITKEENGCHHWTGRHSFSDNYPFIYDKSNNKHIYIRLLVFDHFFPDTLKKGDLIYMECNNEKCVNPEHMIFKKRSREAAKLPYTGISKQKNNTYRVHINKGKKTISVGVFKTLQEAFAAYNKKEEELGF